MFYGSRRNQKTTFVAAGQRLQDCLHSTLHAGYKTFPLEEANWETVRLHPITE